MKIYIAIILVCLLNGSVIKAQEFNGKVTIRSQQVQGVDPKVFEGLETSLNQLLTTTKWTEDSYKPFERIDCSFLLNLTGRTGTNYNGTLTVTASRPVFNTSYMSPIVNYLDKDVTFKYEQGQVIQFDAQRVRGADPMASNLTAIFAYYIYVVLGVNYDTYSQGGGTDYYKKAQNIVINAPEENGISGWKSGEASMKNRFYLIDQFLNPRFANFRPYLYVYHRYGMDMLAEKPEEGKKAIMEGLTNLETLNKENPSNILLQFFFNAKGPEYINLLKGTPENDRKQYAAKLSAIDIPNAARYNDAR